MRVPAGNYDNISNHVKVDITYALVDSWLHRSKLPDIPQSSCETERGSGLSGHSHYVEPSMRPPRLLGFRSSLSPH